MSFGLLGESLSHSYSPLIHRLIGAYEYDLFEIESENIESFIEKGAFSGLNVTFPYKEVVLDLVKADAISKKIGSINTVYRKDGELHGTNTDYFGFMYLLSLGEVDLTDKKILILGTGGASKVVQCVCNMCNTDKVFVASRQKSKKYVAYSSLPTDAEIIINTTPVGTYPNSFERIIDITKFTKCETIIDLVYNPHRTDLLLQGEKSGIKVLDGLPMLVAQATKSAQFFIGMDFLKYNKQILASLKAATLNIALIGMPGSGKTALGRSIAKLTGRKFVDIDDLVSQRANKSIEEIFQEDGEDYFRRMESSVLLEFAKESQLVISTGGGAILSEKNCNYLRSNSVVVEVKRPLNELSLENRPIYYSKSADEIFEARKKLYAAAADICVENNKDIEAIANKTLDMIGEFYEKDCKIK